MESMIVAFTGTGDTVSEAVAEATQEANAWLGEQRLAVDAVRTLHTSTITEASKATGGLLYTYVVTLLLAAPARS